MQNNLICVHHGKLYGPDYVINLWRSAKRYSQQGFNFYVFTDNIAQHPQDLGWRFVKLPEWRYPRMRAWWYKLEIFNYQHQLEGNNLYLDLDNVIVGNIDDFWNYKPEQFRICHDFNRVFSTQINQSNSSVMAWRSNTMSWLYRRFSADMQAVIQTHRGDQDYIHAEIGADRTWWPKEWAMSWKWEIKHGGQDVPNGPYRDPGTPYILHTDTKIVVCHGKPDPHEIPELAGFWNK